MSKSHCPDDLSLGRMLLDTAKDDEPSQQSVHRSRAALMLMVGGAATATATTVSAATTTTKWTVLLKWVGIGAMGGAVTIGTMELSSENRSAEVSVHRQHAASSLTPVASPPPRSFAAPSTVETAPVQSSVPDRVVPLPPRPGQELEGLLQEQEPEKAPEAARSSTVASLAEEVALLDKARRSLSGGRASETLSILDDYQRSYPKGRLGHEVTLVRIQALVLQGNRAQASELAQRFLESNPSSPLAPRMRELIGP